MQITCERCAHGHEIADDRIPPFGARLRCSGCGQLFELPALDNGVRVRVRVGGRRNRNSSADTLPDLVVVTREGSPTSAVSGVRAAPADKVEGEQAEPAPDGRAVDNGSQRAPEAEPAPEVEPAAEAQPAKEAEPPAEPAPSSDAVHPEPGPGPEEPPDPLRLARLLLTDVIYGDRERFERARREGRVLVAFSVEIEQAFSFYRERVGEEIAVETPHFRAALLEVLGRDEPLDD